jgi:hypothetical protein
LNRTGLEWTSRVEEGLTTMRAPLTGGHRDQAHALPTAGSPEHVVDDRAP